MVGAGFQAYRNMDAMTKLAPPPKMAFGAKPKRGIEATQETMIARAIALRATVRASISSVWPSTHRLIADGTLQATGKW